MPTQTQPQVGDGVRLTRSGHSPHSPECAIVVAVFVQGQRTVLRVRWCDGRETFVPANAVEAALG
jgi:hypothetical protein